MDKKYLIAGGIGAAVLVFFVVRKNSAPTEDAGYTGTSYLYQPPTPSGIGMTDYGSPSSSLPGASSNTPTGGSLSDIVNGSIFSDALSKIGATLSLTGGGTVTSTSPSGTSSITVSPTPSVNPNELIVDQFYESIGRTNPDAPGSAYWTAQLSTKSVDDVQHSFLSSAASIMGAQGDTARNSIVSDFYNQIGRANPDTEGKNYWASELKTKPYEQVKRSFFESAKSASAK